MTEHSNSISSEGLSTRLLSRLNGLQIPVDKAIASPQSPEALAALIEACNEEHCRIQYTPHSSSTAHVDPFLTLDMSGLSNVIRFRPEEQLVTVQSGIRLADIERLLRTERLQLPFLYSAHSTLFSILNDHPSPLVVNRHAHIAH